MAVVDPDLQSSDWASDGSDFPTWHCNKDTANDGSSVAVGMAVGLVVATGIVVVVGVVVVAPVVPSMKLVAIVETNVVVVAGGGATVVDVVAQPSFDFFVVVVVVAAARDGIGQPDCTISAAMERE